MTVSYTHLNADQATQNLVNSAITNYYVGNEAITEQTPANWFIFSSPTGTTETLPALPTDVDVSDDASASVTIHNPDAAVAVLYAALYTQPDSGFYLNPTPQQLSDAQTFLGDAYPNLSMRPATIEAALDDTMPPADGSVESCLLYTSRCV